MPLDGETLRLMERMVACDTVTSRGNRALVEIAAAYLRDAGAEVFEIPGPDPEHANLLARTPAAATTRGILFAGHADVVPTEGQAWSTDPFRLTEREGRLYGRGTADMKGYLAVVVARLRRFAAGGAPVSIAMTHDEEVACRGVREILRFAKDRGFPLPRLCVVGEPTGLAPVHAHKSKQSFRCEVSGLECHSALAPRGVNAVELAAELVVWLRAQARRFASHGPFDPDFDPPHATLQVGKIHGGTAVNIVPNHCTFELELRSLPGDGSERVVEKLDTYARQNLIPEMRKVHPDADIQIAVTADYAALSPSPDSEPTATLARITGQPASKVSFATEAGFYQQAGIPTVVCGPGHIAQAHRPDEYVELTQLERCVEVVDAVVAAQQDGN